MVIEDIWGDGMPVDEINDTLAVDEEYQAWCREREVAERLVLDALEDGAPVVPTRTWDDDPYLDDQREIRRLAE